MTVDPGGPAAATPSGTAHLRWIVPAALLAIEYLILTLLVDLPTRGPAMPVVDAIRIGIPVVLGAAAAGWLVARTSGAAALRTPSPVALPPWQPLPALLAQPIAFVATAGLAVHLLTQGAPPPDARALVLLLGSAGLTAALAIAVGAPLPWLGREVLLRWRAPLLGLALGAATWRAAMGAERLWGGLSALTLHAAAGVLRLVAGEVTVDAADSLIGLGGFEVLVAPECSGADGLGLVITFQLLWIALARERLRVSRALWLVPPGMAAALLANVLRISALVLLGAAGHEDLALGAFHSKMGWVLFLAIALGSVAVAERVSWLRRVPAPEPDRAAAVAAGVPEVASLAPLLATLAGALLTGAWATGALDRAYAVRIAAGVAALLAVRRSLPSLRPSRNALPALVGLAVGAGWVLALRGDPLPLAGELAALGATERATWIAARALGSVLVVPVVEELAFRGFLFGWLAGPARPDGTPRGFPWAAVLVSSLAFGAMHGSFALGALAGVAFGAVRAWRGRIGDAVVAHALANAAIAVAAMVLSRWDLWT